MTLQQDFAVRQNAFEVLQTLLLKQPYVNAVYLQGATSDKTQLSPHIRISRADLLEAPSVEELLGKEYQDHEYWTVVSRVELSPKEIGHLALIKLRNDRTLSHPDQHRLIRSTLENLFPHYEGVVCVGTNKLHAYINATLSPQQWRGMLTRLEHKPLAHEKFIQDSIRRSYARLRISEKQGSIAVPQVMYTLGSQERVASNK